MSEHLLKLSGSMILQGCVSRSYLSHLLKHKIRSVWKEEHPGETQNATNTEASEVASVRFGAVGRQGDQDDSQSHIRYEKY